MQIWTFSTVSNETLRVTYPQSPDIKKKKSPVRL
jgi:hypothetical protein